MDAGIEFYEQNAASLIKQYDSVTFQSVHPQLSGMLPESGRVLDVGCGSGRDAVAMAQRGLSVTAVDPSAAMLAHARQQHGDILWLQDSLPSLSAVKRTGFVFDFILLSAVWMHVAPAHRVAAFTSLAELLAPGGCMAVLLRHGEFTDGRIMHRVSFEELESLAQNAGLHARLLSDAQEDVLKRADVHWQLVLIR